MKQGAAAPEGVEADVDLPHLAFGGRGVAVLDDPVQLALGIPNHPAVGARGVFDRGQGGRCSRAAMRGGQQLDGLGPDQRPVSVEDQHIPFPEHVRGRLGQRVAAPLLLVLVGDLGTAADVRNQLELAAVDHGDDAPDAGLSAGVENVVDDWLAAHRVEDFRGPGPHTGAETSG